MKKIKSLFIFLLGIASVMLFDIARKKVQEYTSETSDSLLNENIINFPTELSAKAYAKYEKGEKIFLPNPKKIDDLNSIEANIWVKTSLGIYNSNSNCFIDADVSGNFFEKQNGKPHIARIVVTDFSSEENRLECSKLAMEEVLPLLLKGAFAGIVKAKIYEEGTIFKTFNKEEVAMAAKQSIPLVFDGGFLVETLNVGVLLTPNRFEVYITDCANVKCGE